MFYSWNKTYRSKEQQTECSWTKRGFTSEDQDGCIEKAFKQKEGVVHEFSCFVLRALVNFELKSECLSSPLFMSLFYIPLMPAEVEGGEEREGDKVGWAKESKGEVKGVFRNIREDLN